MADGDRAAVHVDALPIHRIGGRTFPALLPRRRVEQHLCGEGFVDLDEINVRQPQSRALEQSRHRDRRRHQQAFVGMQGRVFHGLDEGQRLSAFLTRPLFAHQQHGRRAVGDGRRIARRDRPFGIEDGLERGQLFERCVGSRTRVLGHAVDGHKFRGQPLAGRDRIPVTGQRNLVLPIARRAPLFAGDFPVLTHGEAGRRLLKGRRVRAAEPFDAAGDARFDPSGGNRVGNNRGRPQARNAVRRNGLRLDVRRQIGFQHDFPREVRFALLGNDGSEGQCLDPLRIDLVPLEQPPHCVPGQRQRTNRSKRLPRLHERRACAGDDGNSMRAHLISFPVSVDTGDRPSRFSLRHVLDSLATSRPASSFTSHST